ncbi:MAG TPA: hypothetical protein VGK76_05680, partial [Candidatus Eisenbacteria bacterium]
QLSLGNLVEALFGFEAALGLALQAAAASPTTPELKPEAHVKPGGDFGVILYYGYVGIARHLIGDASGSRQFEQACAAFEGTTRASKDEETLEDAAFGLDQLRWVERKLVGTGTAAATSK